MPGLVFVEDFRTKDNTDDEVIQAAVLAAGPGANILFEPNKQYTLTNQILVRGFQTLVGNNATLKRADQTFTFLSIPAQAASDSLIIDSIPSGWQIGDQLQIFTDSLHAHSNSYGDYPVLPNKIKSIEGNKIRLTSSIGKSIDASIEIWPVRTYVRKVFTILRGDSINSKSVPFNVVNMNFDGNKEHNDLNFYWNVNSTIFVRGVGAKIADCRFYNIPNENIVGQGIYISNCQARNLNGSFVHLSGIDTIHEFTQKNSIISGNFIDSVCLLNTNVTGHSEGCFTTSYNGGFATIVNNRVYNCGEAAIGDIDAPFDIADGGKSEFIITGNIFKNCKSIVADIANVRTGLTPSTDIYIANNIFSNCGVNDWTKFTGLKRYVGLKIGENSINDTYWKIQ